MTKQILGVLFSAGLIVLASCTREVMHEQADVAAPITNAAPINLDAAVAEAGAGHKLILMDFTGSDWCEPCMQLHKDVFSKPEFESYAQSNLVFLTVDFPVKYRLSPEASATNDWLSEKFNVGGFPTLIVLDSHGKKIYQQLGLGDESGPKDWIAMLDKLKAKAQ